MEKPDPTWSYGVVLELVCTLVNVAGKQCFRLAALRSNWCYHVLGVVLLFCLYTPLNSVALRLAPNSIVCAVDGMIVVWNILLAPLTLGEAITRSRLAAAALITVGTAVAALLGNHTDRDHNHEQYLHDLRQPRALVYYEITGMTILFLFCAAWAQLEKSQRRSGALFALLGGLLAGNAGLYWKAALQFVVESQWDAPWVYVLAATNFLMAGSGIACLAYAMRRNAALYVLPFYEALVILSAGVGGYALYREYEGNTLARILGYWLSRAWHSRHLWPHRCAHACAPQASLVALYSCYTLPPSRAPLPVAAPHAHTWGARGAPLLSLLLTLPPLALSLRRTAPQ